MTPDCMTAEELALWRTSPYSEGWTNPCADCPIWFAEEMTAKGCCNGVPGTNVVERPFTHNRPTYATDAERIAARRRTWRKGKARSKARRADAAA